MFITELFIKMSNKLLYIYAIENNTAIQRDETELYEDWETPRSPKSRFYSFLLWGKNISIGLYEHRKMFWKQHVNTDVYKPNYNWVVGVFIIF